MLTFSCRARRLQTLSAAVATFACLALPTSTLAAEYTVDSTLDEPDAAVGLAGCLTAGLKCTLRAAIQESNASVGTKDTIKFDPAFNGELADTIALGASLPAITDSVIIDGDGAAQCTTAAGFAGPCAGVSGPSGGLGLVVEDDNVTIEGLSVTGALKGINVVDASEGFAARNNWVGLKLDGSAGPNTTGIFLGPDSDGATIGGIAAANRNVISANNSVGLDLDGASEAHVLGNYFGVKPSGMAVASNPVNISVTDSTEGGGVAAEHNEIGTTVVDEAAPCDGGCNLISGATSAGIDLHGASVGPDAGPATGPTTVHGNYVGLNATGTVAFQSAIIEGSGVYVGASADVLIGGAEEGDANFISGDARGITAGGFPSAEKGAEGFRAIGNVIGAGPNGVNLAGPEWGIFLFNKGIVVPAEVAHNVIDGGGIEVRRGGAEIIDNVIEGDGIATVLGPGSAGPNLIEGNVIGESPGGGILIADDQNEVLGNTIWGSDDEGIRLEGGTTGNLIGGDTQADENIIRENGGDAIEIVRVGGTPEDSLNEVARNRGDENDGLFIDLVGGANGGIQPPNFNAATPSWASGTAQPGATVRVFRKASDEEGEIESFLAEGTADGAGQWKLTYPASIPIGTIVAATQTSAAGGTSQLATATTTPQPPVNPPPLCPPAGCGPEERGDPPPETTILKGPKGKVAARKAKFRFASSDVGSTFECKLDRKPFRKCKSPKKYKNLKPGRHVFRVRAIDAAGQVDATPAKRRWRVVEP